MQEKTPELIKSIPLVGANGESLAPETKEEVLPFQDFDLYQMLASQVEPSATSLTEILIGLGEEYGEFLGFHKRMMRGDYVTEQEQEKALYLAYKELGDMLYYMSQWCTIHKLKLGDVPFNNLEKMAKRMEQGNILGAGDEREMKDVTPEEVKTDE